MGHKILWDPARFIDERSKKDFARDGYWFSLWSSIIFGLTFVLVSMVLSRASAYFEGGLREYILSFAIVFAISYVAQAILGYLTKEVVGLLKKEISFTKAFASVSYSFFLISVAFALTSIFGIFPGINLIAPLLGIVFLVRSYGIYIRFLHEYAGLSIIEAYIASVVLFTTIGIGFVMGYNLVGLLNLGISVG